MSKISNREFVKRMTVFLVSGVLAIAGLGSRNVLGIVFLFVTFVALWWLNRGVQAGK